MKVKRDDEDDQETRRRVFVDAMKLYGSQQEMANALGVTQASVSRWVSGDVPVSKATVRLALSLAEADLHARLARRFSEAVDLYNKGTAYSGDDNTARVVFARVLHWVYLAGMEDDPEGFRRALLDVADEIESRRSTLDRWRKERPRRHSGFNRRLFDAEDSPGAFFLQMPAVVMSRLVEEHIRRLRAKILRRAKRKGGHR